MKLCVYALALGRPDHLPRSLRAISVGPITAIVRAVSRRPNATDAGLRAHDRFVRLLAVECPALLPARFGTCFDDGEELKAALEARQASLRKALRHVRGRVQMTIRIAAGSSAAYLQSRARAAAAARSVPEFAPLRDAVRRWVKDERVEKHGRLASVYHLITSGSTAAYRRRLERAAADAEARLIVTGPHPPYAFSNPFEAS